ncbi:MAG: class I SAM-dependent methyltransferase [Acidiferrobacter sp.]
MILDNRRTYNEPWLDERTRRRPVGAGQGIDVASQRADDLDERCLAFLDARFARNPAVRPSALDLACGQGGQALRMAAGGAQVTAIDRLDQGTTLQRAASDRALWQPPVFVQADFRALPNALPGAPYDAIICQRAIHYVSYDEALTALQSWLRHLKPGGRIFLSASGLASELGRGYPHWGRPVAERWARLAPAMADRHDIRQPVCLYEAMDLINLLHAAGFGIAEVFRSPFGNVKAVAFV